MLPLLVNVKLGTFDRAGSIFSMDGEERTRVGGSAQREESLAGETKVRPLLAKKNHQAEEINQQSSAQNPPHTDF